MSNYRALAIHPITGKAEQADFLDDYFGRHRYGIRFADGLAFPDSADLRGEDDL